jgi:hypothetical protein
MKLWAEMAPDIGKMPNRLTQAELLEKLARLKDGGRGGHGGGGRAVGGGNQSRGELPPAGRNVGSAVDDQVVDATFDDDIPV